MKMISRDQSSFGTHKKMTSIEIVMLEEGKDAITVYPIKVTVPELEILRKLITWLRTNSYGEFSLNLHSYYDKEAGEQIKRVDITPKIPERFIL